MKYIINIIMCLYVPFTKGYMSTRISPNEDQGWTMEENIKLSYTRQRMLGGVMNPVCLNSGIIGWVLRVVCRWGHHEYMYVWNNVLRTYALMGKPMYYYTEDHTGSRGCKEEYQTALSLGMDVVCVD